MVGLQYLFLEPNADDPLNKGAFGYYLLIHITWVRLTCSTEAAEELRRNREQFVYNVQNSMRGGNIKGVQYAKVLAK